MKKLNKEIENICKKEEWNLFYNTDLVDLEKYSPSGEDFSFSVYIDNFVENVKEFTNTFDTEDHIEMWIEAKKNGIKNIPSIRELVEDADNIKSMLQRLANRLSKVNISMY